MSVLFRRAWVFRAEHRDFVLGDVLVSAGRIKAVSHEADLDVSGIPHETIDAEGYYLIPGLVDVHTHGRAGGDFSTADADLMRLMSMSYLASGVTTLLPTLASAPLEVLHEAAERVETVRRETQGDTA